LAERLFGEILIKSPHLKEDKENALKGIQQLTYCIIPQQGHVIPESFFAEDISQLHTAALQNRSFDLFPFRQFINICLKGELLDEALMQAEVDFLRQKYRHFDDMHFKASRFIKAIIKKLATGKIAEEYSKSDNGWWARFDERIAHLKSESAKRLKLMDTEYISRKSQAGLK